MRNLKEAGDTLVEVMVVLAVLGLAISISYATANRSLLNARQAQENSEATELVQAQIERMRTMTANPQTLPSGLPNPNYIFRSIITFCVDDNFNVRLSSSVYCNSLGSVPYSISTKYLAPTFTVTASWPDIEGQGTDTVTLSYRMYPQS